MTQIGFVQGRLLPLIDGKIQAFPVEHWRAEFPLAAALGFPMFEWTLDQDDLRNNPLLTEAGQSAIRGLTAQHGVSVSSVSGDCFMHAPFYKENGAAREMLLEELELILSSSAALGLRHVLIPLVDNGRLDERAQEDDLVAVLQEKRPWLEQAGLQILFESDFQPQEVERFMRRLPERCFGINYDIGNSASLGYRPAEEFHAYGDRIDAIHVKDRLLGGTTVPLGTGAADFPGAFNAMSGVGYTGDFILQTARAKDNSHGETLCRYRDMTISWIANAGMGHDG